MSQKCGLPECPRPAMDGEFACSLHDWKISFTTQLRLKGYRTVTEEVAVAAREQAVREMREVRDGMLREWESSWWRRKAHR